MKNFTYLTLCLSLTCAALLPRLCAAAPGEWNDTGSLIVGRDNHTATLLPNGSVLAVGGSGASNGAPLDSTELYNPATGTWTSSGAA